MIYLRKVTRTAISLSLICHIVLLALVTLHWHLSKSYAIPGYQHIIHAQLQQNIHKLNSEHHSNVMSLSSLQPKLNLKYTKQHKTRVHIHHQQAKPRQLSGQQYDQMMAKLYQAINAHKRYPMMAQNLGQQGRVALKFILMPSGLITHVSIVQSSGYVELDQAAINAITNVHMFSAAKHFLTQPKTITLSINFVISE